MSAVEFTTADVERVVRELAAEFPDRVAAPVDPNEACSYFIDGQPSCIVGHAFARLGLPTHKVREGRNVSYQLDRLGLDLSEFLAYVQANQDRRAPWGDAVCLADAHQLAEMES